MEEFVIMSVYKSRKAGKRKNGEGCCLKEKREIGRKYTIYFLIYYYYWESTLKPPST